MLGQLWPLLLILYCSFLVFSVVSFSLLFLCQWKLPIYICYPTPPHIYHGYCKFLSDTSSSASFGCLCSRGCGSLFLSLHVSPVCHRLQVWKTQSVSCGFLRVLICHAAVQSWTSFSWPLFMGDSVTSTTSSGVKITMALISARACYLFSLEFSSFKFLWVNLNWVFAFLWFG